MSAKNRPKKVPSETVVVSTGCGKLYVTVGKVDGVVREVFMRLGKAGNCVPAWSEALARTLSIALQHDVPLDELVRTLKNIKCPTPSFDDGVRYESCIDAVAKVLEGGMNDS